MLASRPQTAEFVSRELVEHYIGAPADEALVKQSSIVYLRNGGNCASCSRHWRNHPS